VKTLYSLWYRLCRPSLENAWQEGFEAGYGFDIKAGAANPYRSIQK
jgi:hypothetical protein